MERARAGEELTVDLEARTAGGYPFELDDFTRDCLLQGLDEIGLTLRDEPAIAAYESRARLSRCPLFPPISAPGGIPFRVCTSRRPS